MLFLGQFGFEFEKQLWLALGMGKEMKMGIEMDAKPSISKIFNSAKLDSKMQEKLSTYGIEKKDYEKIRKTVKHLKDRRMDWGVHPEIPLEKDYENQKNKLYEYGKNHFELFRIHQLFEKLELIMKK